MSPRTRARTWTEDSDFLRDVLGNHATNELVGEMYALWKRNSNDPTIRDQVAAEMQRGLADMLREDGHNVPVNLGSALQRSGRTGLYAQKAPGAGLNGVFDSFGEYLQAVWHKSDPNSGKLAALRNYSTSVPSEGGFIVPEQFRSELLSVSLESSIVRPRATVIPMDTLRLSVPGLDSTSNESSVYGGVEAFWTAEGSTLQPTSPKFQRVKLESAKLTIYGVVPNELMADAPQAMQAVTTRILPQAISFFEDIAFLTGSGAGEPLGVLNGDGVISVTRESANQISFVDVINMFSRMLPDSLSRAVWVASIDTFPQLAQLKITVDDGVNPTGVASPVLWLNNGQAIGAPPMSLLGRPVIFTEKTPSLGSAGDLALVDFSYYLLGDRQAMQLRTSEHINFDTDETAVRLIERADGRPWLQSAITPHNGGPTLSPYVKLN